VQPAGRVLVPGKTVARIGPRQEVTPRTQFFAVSIDLCERNDMDGNECPEYSDKNDEKNPVLSSAGGDVFGARRE
jgi:hypothetical protein